MAVFKNPARPRFPRSNVTGNSPDALAPGSLAFNWKDKVIWVGSSTGTPVRFSKKIENWSSSLAYSKDDFVIYDGDLYRALFDQSPGSFVLSQWQRLSDRARSTYSEPYASGLISGGLISANTSTSISVAAGRGTVVDNTSPDAVVFADVSWSAFNVTLTHPAENFSVIGINSSGSANIVPCSAMDSEYRRDHVILGLVAWNEDQISIGEVIPSAIRGGDAAETYLDEYYANGGAYRVRGVKASGIGGTLNLSISSGQVFAVGFNWRNDLKSPNLIDIAAIATASFCYLYSDGIQAGGMVTDVDPDVWDNNGSLQAVPAGNFTIQYVYISPDASKIFVTYGTSTYASENQAVSSIATDYEQVRADLGVDCITPICAIIVEQGSANLNAANFVDARRGLEPFTDQEALDTSSFYLLDGSRPLLGDMDAGGNAILDTVIDGGTISTPLSDIKVRRSETTGEQPATTTAADEGQISAHITDGKVYVKNSSGAPVVVADKIKEYSASSKYYVNDFCIESDLLYICTTDVTVPEAFDPGKWTSIGGGTPTTGNEILTGPVAPGRNTIDVAGSPTVEGLRITGDPVQSEDLLIVEGTGATDTGFWSIDSLGFPNKRGGSVAWRQGAPSHPFTAVGQPVAFDGSDWVLGDASVPGLKTYGLLQEIIDANTIVIRADGILDDLEVGAFSGGSISVGSVYYVSETAGLLTTSEPAQRQPAILVTSANKGLVLTYGGLSTGDFVVRTGDEMSGALTTVTASPFRALRPSAANHEMRNAGTPSGYTRALHNPVNGNFLWPIETVAVDVSNEVESISWSIKGLGTVASLDFTTLTDLPSATSLINRGAGDDRYLRLITVSAANDCDDLPLPPDRGSYVKVRYVITTTVPSNAFPGAAVGDFIEQYYNSSTERHMVGIGRDGFNWRRSCIGGVWTRWIQGGNQTRSGTSLPIAAESQEGDLFYKTTAPVGMFVYNGGSWVDVAAREFHDPTNVASWSISTGGKLEVWGKVMANGFPTQYFFPKTFAREPMVVGTAISSSSNPKTVQVSAVTTTEFSVESRNSTGSGAPSDIYYQAVGEWDGIS